MLFNIPKGYKYSKESVYWQNGLTLESPDSTISIFLNSQTNSWGEDLTDLYIDDENEVYPLWSYCYDNSDSKVYVKEDALSYTKIGFNQNYKSTYGKGLLYYSDGIGYRPHLIRIEYLSNMIDSVIRIIWQIDSYPYVTNLTISLK